MYLYIWRTGESSVVEENFTPIDLLACKTKILDIYKFVPDKGYYKLVIKTKLVWEKVKTSKVAICNNIRLHN